MPHAHDTDHVRVCVRTAMIDNTKRLSLSLSLSLLSLSLLSPGGGGVIRHAQKPREATDFFPRSKKRWTYTAHTARPISS